MKNKLINELEKLEPVFIEAAQLAVKMQKTAKHHNKYNTGFSGVDIVTEADLAVQDFLLSSMAKTELVNCRLLAEENTKLTSKFTGTNGYNLSIDPIDGTGKYAKGGKFFSTIVSLNNGKDLLYTFVHFPVLNLTHKIVENNYTTQGSKPKLIYPPANKKSILHYAGEPDIKLGNFYKELTAKGFEFVNVIGHTEDVDMSCLFMYQDVAGFYCQDPNVYDGVVYLHFAKAQGLKVLGSGGDGLDLNNIKKRESGFYYSGHYLALN